MNRVHNTATRYFLSEGTYRVFRSCRYLLAIFADYLIFTCVDMCYLVNIDLQNLYNKKSIYSIMENNKAGSCATL